MEAVGCELSDGELHLGSVQGAYDCFISLRGAQRTLCRDPTNFQKARGNSGKKERNGHREAATRERYLRQI